TANGLWPAFWFMGNDRTFNINNFDNSWPYCGEIDVMECGNSGGIVSNNQAYNFGGALHWGTLSPYIHYMDYTSLNAPYSIQDNDFHLYTLIWNADSIKMYLDQDKYPAVKPFFAQRIQNGSNTPNGGGGSFSAIYDQFHKPFYILYNLAVGGTYTGIYDINNITALASDGSSAKMYIDYVRIYQKGDLGEEFHSATTYSDTEKPILTSATLGAVTRTTAEILVNGTDNSGSVIYCVSANGKTWSNEVASGNQKSVIATGLSASTTYNFTVTTKDASGNVSINSIPVSATTGANSDCEGISNVASQGTFDTGFSYSFATSGTNVTLNFEMLDNKSGIVAFLWDYTSSFVETQMTNVGGNKFSVKLTGKTTGSIIKVACKFAYAGGMSVTKQLSYIVGNNCGAAGLENIVSNETFIYPNPTKDVINIKSDYPVQTVTVSSLLGQTLKVTEIKGDDKVINISEIPSGNYLITAKLENGKILVNRIVKN
ncbi:MAG: T9SS type A sorting domain-containing protein, partial [Paludibacter sp.]